MADFVTSLQVPRQVVRGVDNALRLSVYDAIGVLQVVSAGALAVYHRSTLIASPAVVVSPATAVLTAAATADRQLGEVLLEVWTLTIGAVAYTFTQEAHLVRYVLRPTLRDADLLDHYPDLLHLAGSAVVSFAAQRRVAWDRVYRELTRRGVLPGRVLSPTALRDAHFHATMVEVARWFWTSLNSAHWKERLDHHEERLRAEWAEVDVWYDADDDGTPDERRTRAARPLIWTQ